MIDKNQPSLTEVFMEAHAFKQSFDSLLLATANREARPGASYAVYVTDEQGRYFVYVSDLAVHTGNLRHNPHASIMFIEDENQAKHLFGRRRLICDCRVEAIARGEPLWKEIMDRFIEKHGKFMTMLKDLQDFHLFSLTPEKATFVRGFAQAYELRGDRLQEIRHVNDRGHQPKDASTEKAMTETAEV